MKPKNPLVPTKKEANTTMSQGRDAQTTTP